MNYYSLFFPVQAPASGYIGEVQVPWNERILKKILQWMNLRGISRSSDQDMLTELLKTLVTTMSEGQEYMANLMKRTLNKESMTQEEYRVERERSEKQKRRERILTKIADIKDGDDPEVYLESLKNKLIQANVPQDEWKLLLISHLTGKYLVMIQDIEADPGYGLEVQSRILDCCGLTSTMAGQQFHKFVLQHQC